MLACLHSVKNENQCGGFRFQAAGPARRAYFHFHGEGRHVGVLGPAHDDLLQRVPLVVAADRTFLLKGLSNSFLFSCVLLCSCCTGRALEGPLHPAGDGAAQLWGGGTKCKISSEKCTKANPACVFSAAASFLCTKRVKLQVLNKTLAYLNTVKGKVIRDTSAPAVRVGPVPKYTCY